MSPEPVARPVSRGPEPWAELRSGPVAAPAGSGGAAGGSTGAGGGALGGGGPSGTGGATGAAGASGASGGGGAGGAGGASGTRGGSGGGAAGASGTGGRGGSGGGAAGASGAGGGTMAAPIVLSDDGGWCWFEAPRALFQGSRLVIGSVASGWSDASRKGDIDAIVHDLRDRRDHHRRAAQPARGGRSRLARVPRPSRRPAPDALREARNREPFLFPAVDREQPAHLGRRADVHADGRDAADVQQRVPADRGVEPRLRLLSRARRQLQTVLRVLRRSRPDVAQRQRRHQRAVDGDAAAPVRALRLERHRHRPHHVYRSAPARLRQQHLSRLLQGRDALPQRRHGDSSADAGADHPRRGYAHLPGRREQRRLDRRRRARSGERPARTSCIPSRSDRRGCRPGRAATDMRYRYARWDGTAWRDHPLAYAGRGSTRARTTTPGSPCWTRPIRRSSTSRPTRTRRRARR